MIKTGMASLLTGTAVGTLAATPVVAADLPPEEVPAELHEYWTGFYLAAGVSVNWLNGTVHAYGDDDFTQKSTYIERRTRDSDYGFGLLLEAGYDHQISENAVLGVSVDGTVFVNDLGISGFGSAGADNTYREISYHGKIDGMVSAVGRAGVLISPKSLLYALGGVAWTRYDTGGRYYASFGFGDGFSWSRSSWETSWTAGLGLETHLQEKLTFKLEYRYTDLKPVTASTAGVNFADFDFPYGGGTRFDPGGLHSVIGKIGYRF